MLTDTAIVLQKNTGILNIGEKSFVQTQKLQNVNIDNEISIQNQNESFQSALDYTNLNNASQNIIKPIDEDQDSDKDESDNVSKNQENSFVLKREASSTTQTYHKKYIYKPEASKVFVEPSLSNLQKKNHFLSQVNFIQQVIYNQEQFYQKQQELNKQLDNTTIKIFKQIKEFSIGTYKYIYQNEKYKKQFIPIFPHLYLENKIDSDNPKRFNEIKNFNLENVECNFYNKFAPKKARQNLNEKGNAQDDEIYSEHRRFPTHIQLKFTLDNKDFLKGTREHQILLDALILKKCEEDRNSMSESAVEDFEQIKNVKQTQFENNDYKELEKEIESKKREFQLNIKLLNSRLNINFAPKIFYEYDDSIEGNLGNFDIVIEQNVPAEFMERKSHTEKTYQNSISPLQYNNDLINYWNLKQIIFIRGQKNLDFDPESFFKTLVEQELIQSFENKIPKEYDFSYVSSSQDENNNDDETINRQTYEVLQKELEEIKQLGNEFETKMNELAMPLRLSIMVLISNQKIQIIDRNIIDLIDYLVKEKKFGFEYQQALQIRQSSEYWNSEYPEKFDYKYYQIAIEQLYFKSGMIEFDRPLQEKELIKLIQNQIDEISQDNSSLKKEIKEQTRNPNKLAQRRFWITPTLKIVRPMELEQSNPLLRQLKQVIEYFARINIMNDNFQDFFFNNEMQNNLLEQFVEPVIKEINICGIKYKFLNYSASQIKSKSWWQLVDNHGFSQNQRDSEIHKQIQLIKNRDTLLEFMGKFNDPKQLKQLARQGQSMSSSIFVCDIKPENIRIIEDVKNKDYAFTDGCGYISQTVMDKVCSIFDLYQASAIQMRFSGFKGVLMVHPDLGKTSNENSQQLDILFSQGMRKFEGNINQLSVIRCATFSPGFLNRQVILILSHLGVRDELFIEKNSEAIDRLDVRKTLGRLYKMARAIRQIEKNNFGLSLKSMKDEMQIFFGPSKQFKPIFVRALLMCSKYKESIEGNIIRGFMIDQEPVFEQILLNMVLSQGQILKKKQRIRLRDAAVLIGVCDIHDQIRMKQDDNDQEPISEENLQALTDKKYSNLLGENEIFCQIEPMSFQKAQNQEKRFLKKGLKISLNADIEKAKQIQKEIIGGEDSQVQHIKGNVLITKNPCGHEGDIRLAKAIDENHPAYEKLKHLVNVIVFPVVGQRPLQNQMSGGDLDGDVYMIIWDKDIVEQATKSDIPPPSQDDSNVLELHTEDIGEKDGYDFSKTICGYFKRDMLGFLSNLHLKLALQKSLKNEDTQLAGLLCQVQVDFAKHGKCVKLESINELKRKVNGVPKFLADDKEEYESLNIIECDHVIQQLYDQVNLKNMFEECLRKEHDFSILYKYSFSKFIIEINTDDQIKDFLELNYSQYLVDLYLKFVYPMEVDLKKKLLIRYKILNEGELFCSDFKYRFSDDKQNDYIGALGKSDEDLVRDISQELDEIIKKYRKEFSIYCEKISEKEYSNYKQNLIKKQLIQQKEDEESSQISSSQESNKGKKKERTLDEKQYLQKVKAFQAKCLYIASYFHLQNEQSKTILQKIKGFLENNQKAEYKASYKKLQKFINQKYVKEAELISEYNNDFNISSISSLNESHSSQEDNQSILKDLIDDINQNDQQFISNMRDELKNFKKYKQICKKAESNNLDKINFLWSFKKILSVPWLIAYDYILV